MQKRLGFVLEPGIKGFFLWLDSIFRLSVRPRGYILAIIRNTYSISSEYQTRRWSYSCLEQLPPLRPLCIWGAHGTTTIRCLQMSYCIFVSQGLPLHWVRPPRPARSCIDRVGFSRCMLQTTKW